MCKVASLAKEQHFTKLVKCCAPHLIPGGVAMGTEVVFSLVFVIPRTQWATAAGAISVNANLRGKEHYVTESWSGLQNMNVVKKAIWLLLPDGVFSP